MNRMKPQYQAAFESYVKEVMNVYEAPGVAVSIIDKNSTLYERCFGYRDLEKQLPLNADTIFGLASITKSFTCLAIMQLAEEGKLDLDDPVSMYIPEFQNSNQDTIKIHHLMSHAAGYFPLMRITADNVAKELGIFETIDGDLAYSEKLASEGIKLVAQRLDQQTKLIGKPGEYLSYSNDCYGLLADIIRRVGDADSYAEYVNRHILKPLDMSRSSCEFVSVREDANTNTLYIHRGGKLTATDNFYDNAFVLMGGGAMKSTLNDMKKYLSMYINRGIGGESERIIDDYSIREMAKPRQYYKHLQYYGYGLSSMQIGEVLTVGHGGSLTGVSTYFLWSPELELGVVVLCNTSGVPASAIGEAAMKWCIGLDPTEPTLRWQETPWDADTIEAACGRYVSGEGSVVTIAKKEAGISVDISGEEFPVTMVLPTLALLQTKLTQSELKLYKDESGYVWGVGFGGRIIPRADQ